MRYNKKLCTYQCQPTHVLWVTHVLVGSIGDRWYLHIADISNALLFTLFVLACSCVRYFVSQLRCFPFCLLFSLLVVKVCCYFPFCLLFSLLVVKVSCYFLVLLLFSLLVVEFVIILLLPFVVILLKCLHDLDLVVYHPAMTKGVKGN